jgi:DNA-binding FrmR family transcriptional regulator
MAASSLEEDISRRLRRIEGQVRGVLKMLEEGRDCEEMLTQTMATRSALDQVGARIMEYHLGRCVLSEIECDEDQLERLRQALALWTKFGQPAPAMALPYEAAAAVE